MTEPINSISKCSVISGHGKYHTLWILDIFFEGYRFTIVCKVKMSLITLFLFSIQGCAALGEFFGDLDKINQTKQRLCNYDGAFAEGTSDAKSGYAIDSKKINSYCEENKDALQGYRDGFLNYKK